MSNPAQAQAMAPRQSRDAAACPACQRSAMTVFYEVEQVPSNSCILLSSREEAINYPRGDIRLAFCPGCGFICNVAFDPKLTEYSGRYEETQGFSPTFNSFHERLARSLVERHDLHGKDLIEIGCGKGEFLKLLCDLGGNQGLGFDPGYSEQRGEEGGASRFQVVRDFFSDTYADRSADFVACKMTLEHIADPCTFVGAAARTVRKPGGSIFIQVPESLRILKVCAFEDVYYEHCSYFTTGSLGRLLERLGFSVTHAAIEYGDQYLTVGATPRQNTDATVFQAPADLEELASLVASFPNRARRVIDEWSDRLSRWRRAGRRVVIWGSGSKGVSFLTTVPGASEAVEYAVDINPYRKGYFMAGTGQEILSPEELPRVRPAVVIVMNSVYVPEISNLIGSLGLTPEIVAL
jgi:2-polyprenyl-3-methyl-5-hydroxy-6-metoxy-1,4-benzoquinol methylase